MKKPKLKIGKYQHFKNKKFYEVKNLALNTETEGWMVIYKALYKSDIKYFVRPYKMFFQKTKSLETGKLVSRFKYIKSKK